MSWDLTTPINVGVIDPSGAYGEVRIVRLVHDSRDGFIELELEYGNTVVGEWQGGSARLPPATYLTTWRIDGAAYDAFVSANQSLYDSVKSALYAKLNTDGVIASGSVI